MGAIKGVAQFDVAKQLNDIIKSYNWDAREKIKEAGQYCAKEMAKELRNCPNFAAGAGKYSTGAYNKGWSSRKRVTAAADIFILTLFITKTNIA